jgi:hypothetical protein
MQPPSGAPRCLIVLVLLGIPVFFARGKRRIA